MCKHVVEWRDDVVDRDGVISHAKDTVKFPESEGETGLLRGFGKFLLLDREVADADGVLRDESLKRARAVTNGELRAVRLVCGRSARVVLRVELEEMSDP